MSAEKARLLVQKLHRIEAKWDRAIWSDSYTELDGNDDPNSSGYKWAHAWRTLYHVTEEELFRLPGAASFLASRGGGGVGVFVHAAQSGFEANLPSDEPDDHLEPKRSRRSGIRALSKKSNPKSHP